MNENDKIKSRYEIVEKLGEGGTAIVYMGFDTVTEEYVAIKTLKREHVDERKIKYFQREAQTISRFDSPYIIRFYDFGYDEEHEIHYIIQEYVEGMTLKNYLKMSNKLTVNEIVNISTMIISGLNHAHEKGVIHKDIKSQNILININKEVKIADFGISDVLEDDTTKTQTLMGTPQYVAPETLNRGEITYQTDIYSVGILMYELLCGTTPFKGEKPTVIMMKQLNQPIPSIRMQRAEVPQSLENIVIKATAKKLENRYKNTKEMLNDLNNVFSVSNENIDKLVFYDDTLSSTEIDETIELNPNFNKDIKKNYKNEETKKNHKIIRYVIIAILIFVLGLLVFTNKSAADTTMPNLVGQKYEDLSITDMSLYGLNKDNIDVQYEYNDEIDEGVIISTYPEAGEPITEDTIVEIVVSEGEETFPLDDYVGKLYGEVKSELENAGYVVSIITEDSSEPENTILSQTPAVNTGISKGDEITFVVSSGIEEFGLENFTGLTETEVSEYVDNHGLDLVIKYECHAYYTESQVISQEPSAGTIVKEGDSVTITVSSGTCPIDSTQNTGTTTDNTTNTTTDNTLSTATETTQEGTINE